MTYRTLLLGLAYALGAGHAFAQESPTVVLDSIAVNGGLVAHRFSEAQTPGSGLSAAPVARAGSSPGLGRAVDLGVSLRTEKFSHLGHSVAALPGGGFATVWQEGTAPGVVVRLQYVRPSGESVFPNGGLVLSNQYGRTSEIALTPHPSSGVLVAFAHANSYSSSGIRVQWIDAAGQRRWTEGGVWAFGRLQDNLVFASPHIVANADGGAYVCASSFSPTSNEPIRCQRIDADGNRIWAAQGLAAGGVPGWRVLPKAVHDGNDGLLVFWKNNRVLGDAEVDPILVEGQHFAADGQPLWSELGKVIHTTSLAETDQHLYTEFDAVGDGVGGAIVAFENWNGVEPASRDVFVQRVKSHGDLVWGQGVAAAAGTVAQQLDTLVATPGGGAIVSVMEYYPPDRMRLRVYSLDPKGAHAWGESGLPLSDPAATAWDYGGFGHVDGGRFRIAYVHQQQANTYTYDVYFAEYTLNGARLVPASGLPLYTGEDAQWMRGFAYDAEHGVSLAVFDDFHPNGNDWWSTRGVLYAPPVIFQNGFEAPITPL